MFDFHTQWKVYFEMQRKVTKNYILPYIKSEVGPINKLRVLEIGCAHAGVLKAFLDEGANVMGVELRKSTFDIACQALSIEIKEGKAEIINSNIYDVDPESDPKYKFDLIILKDVIEHIHDQDKFISQLGGFLKKDGKVFFGYPPWTMPFGGHQQVCKSKILSFSPWFHLLPTRLYAAVLKAFGESKNRITDLLEIKETGISSRRLFKLLKTNNFHIVKHNYWFINPIYAYKFNLKPRKNYVHLPILGDFYSTAHYVLFEKK